MGKIIMLNRVSIDGFFAGPDNKSMGMDWFIPDPKVDKAAHKLVSQSAAVSLLLLGRITYKHFEKSWVPLLTDPAAPKEMKATAKELTDMNKLVFSKTLKERDIVWENTRLLSGDLIGEVKNLKQKKGGILILGSGSLVQQLSKEGLMDEYVFIMTPVVSGEGKLLFKDVKQFGLKLISAKSFDSGNVLMHYGSDKKGHKNK